MKSRVLLFQFTLFIPLSILFAQKLPIGMNIASNNYWVKQLIFTDVMKTASALIAFNASGDSPWDTGLIALIETDSAGYPIEIPYTPAGELPQKVRFLINNYYNGTHTIKFDGSGDLTINAAPGERLGSNRYSIELNGQGGHVWIDIDRSESNDPIRDIRIIPEMYADNEESMPLFDPRFLEGLRPFHALRFMDWMNINGSEQDTWESRSKTWFYTQGLEQGIAIEYAIQLCNELDEDAWFCVPHKADDNYITKFAEMVRNSLDQDLKVYIEYSNEIWNWGFDQSHYILENAPGHFNQYVSDDLSSISPNPEHHPEKDAYMMQRTFRLWFDVFSGGHEDRLVRVATGQHAWTDNTRRILRYLFKKDRNGNAVNDAMSAASTGAGCDMFAVGGYFNFEERHHNAWNGMDPADVTPEMIIDSVFAVYDETSGLWTDETANYVNNFNVGYLVYEGGQHMQPWMQGEYAYNQSIWDAQIHPKMYDLYMLNFNKHATEHVNCQLFMAFSYVGERESRWGSWGHLESMDQIGSDNYMEIAPKYQALLDANTDVSSSAHDQINQPNDFTLSLYPNPFNTIVKIDYSLSESMKYRIDIYNILGQHVINLADHFKKAGNYQIEWNGTDNLNRTVGSGVYVCRFMNAGLTSKTHKMVLLK